MTVRDQMLMTVGHNVNVQPRNYVGYDADAELVKLGARTIKYNPVELGPRTSWEKGARKILQEEAGRSD
jgi:hypothetical protein